MSHIFELLDRDWAALCRNRRTATRLEGARRVAGGAATLADLEGYVRGAAPEPADRVLVALVSSACARGDDHALAARTLFQLLLPGTRRMARRWWAIGNEDERAAAAITAVYNRIRTYPLDRRPARVAANILLDAERELRRAVPSPLVEPTDDLAGTTVDDGRPTEHAAVELARVLMDAAEHDVISRNDAALIARSRIGGARIDDLAAVGDLRPRTLWDRRRRAEHALTESYLARCS